MEGLKISEWHAVCVFASSALQNQRRPARCPHHPLPPSHPQVFQTGGGSGRDAGACVASFAQLGYHAKGGISALLFSADGATLYSGASDGTLAGWRLSWREAAGGAAAARGLRRGFL